MNAYGRVYIGPEPERGAHAGYRGLIIIDACGVHITTNAEWLFVDNDEEGWPMGEWEPVEMPQTIPWHRVHLIEWDDRYAPGADRGPRKGS